MSRRFATTDEQGNFSEFFLRPLRAIFARKEEIPDVPSNSEISGIADSRITARSSEFATAAQGERADQAIPNSPDGRQALADSAEVKATFVGLAQAAKNPDLLIVGSITRNANQAVTSADVMWPDGTPGTFAADTLSTAFPGAVDGYHVTYGSPVTKTFTQPAITRNTAGAATNVPQIVVS